MTEETPAFIAAKELSSLGIIPLLITPVDFNSSYIAGLISLITESLSSKSLNTPFSSKQYTRFTAKDPDRATASSEATVSALVFNIVPLQSCVSGATTGVMPCDNKCTNGCGCTFSTSPTKP